MVRYNSAIAKQAYANAWTSVIKQRMQVHKSEFRSAFTCARTVYHNEGLSAFYISYPTTLTMTIPFTAVQFTVYEQLKKFINPGGSYSPTTHMISGGLAGAVAGAVTTPLDVAKTILQTRGASSDPEIRHAKGMMDAFRIIWKRDGMKGFARGLSPRVLTFMPSNALCWLSYEFFSAYLSFPNSGDGYLTIFCRGRNTGQLELAPHALLGFFLDCVYSGVKDVTEASAGLSLPHWLCHIIFYSLFLSRA